MVLKLLFSLFILCMTPAWGQVLDSLGGDQDQAPVIIDADQSVVCDEPAQKCVATGHARAQKGTSIVYGDVLTVYFTKDREITAMEATGNVRMETPTETAYGGYAHYDVALDRVLMKEGDLKLVCPKQTITATDSLEYWHTKREGIARGKAVAQFPEKQELIQADTLTTYFRPTQEDEKKIEIDRVEAVGNFHASSPNGVITGNRATYDAQSEFVEVFENVKLTQGENILQGGYGRANLKANLAEVFPYKPGEKTCGPPKRISGVIIPKSVKKTPRSSALKKS